MTTNAFNSLALSIELLDNLASLEYHEMTPIQAQSLPHILANKDVIAQGQTGSGKTAAFGLGLLQKLDVKRFRIQTIVLCPTRELADQVAKEIRRLARTIHNIKVLTLCGGSPIGPQIGSLEHGAHIIVGTPGRIEDHLRKQTLSLEHVDTLILDEADRMLEMGFQTSLDAVIDACPAERQTLLFSATYPEQIQSIAKRVMNNPELIKVESSHDSKSIEQHFYKITSELERYAVLEKLLLLHSPQTAVVFCNTKQNAQDIADQLNAAGHSAAALHGDLEQRERDQTLVRFANKSVVTLVATDVAARGLDIDALDLVINYHIARDVEVHTHRIGRTGRAGAKGLACSLFSDKEHYKVALLQDYLDLIITGEPHPEPDANNNPVQPTMTTIQIDAGKKQKIRPGDILGALTRDDGITGDDVGKIQVLPMRAYVAVKKTSIKQALQVLERGKIKGRSIKVRHLKK